MSQSVKIDFVALTSLAPQMASAAASKRTGKNKTAQTLVLFVGQDLGFGTATRNLVGAEGEALIKRAAGAAKFKGKGSTALDIVAPSGFAADRLIVIGTGPASEEAAKSGKGKERDQETKPDDYLTLGGFVLSKLGVGAAGTVVFDLPRPPMDAAAAAAQFAQRAKNFILESPLAHCLPEGMPMVETSPAPYKIIQTPGMTVMLYERDTTYRQIYTDGRKLPDDPEPSWLGYSIGQWEGDTFVVSSIGFNDRGWLDARGHTHTESLHLTERFRRLDFGHMQVQLTVDDPKTYTRPFTVTLQQLLVPDSDLLESFCTENEKDMRHIPNRNTSNQ